MKLRRVWAPQWKTLVAQSTMTVSCHTQGISCRGGGRGVTPRRKAAHRRSTMARPPHLRGRKGRRRVRRRRERGPPLGASSLESGRMFSTLTRQ